MNNIRTLFNQLDVIMSDEIIDVLTFDNLGDMIDIINHKQAEELTLNIDKVIAYREGSTKCRDITNVCSLRELYEALLELEESNIDLIYYLLAFNDYTISEILNAYNNGLLYTYDNIEMYVNDILDIDNKYSMLDYLVIDYKSTFDNLRHYLFDYEVGFDGCLYVWDC